MPAVAELTVSQKIILAAYHLEEEGNTPFKAAEALHRCRLEREPEHLRPERFAEQHPDANRVLACTWENADWLAAAGS